MKKKRNKFRRFLLISFVAGLVFLIGTYPVMLNMISKSRQDLPDSGRDAVIILGAGLSGGKTVSLTLRERLDGAIPYILENTDAIVIVSGGQGSDELVSEAFAMREYLIANGIDEKRILMEDKSTSTKENFLFTKQLLDSLFDKPYTTVFATNDFHCPRAGFYAAKAGLDAQPLACKTPVFMEKIHYPREYLALIWYYIIESWQSYR